MNKIFATLLLALIAGCATPVQYTDKSLIRHDKNTQYRVEDTEDGFVLFVSYNRYQFIPESGAVSEAAKSAVTSLAYEVADNRGKQIEPINEQRIMMSMGRNGVSGITSWNGKVRVFYKKP